MKNTMLLPLTILLTVSLAGCAGQHKAEKHIEQEMKAVKVEEKSTPGMTARESIANSTELSADQKAKLLALQEKTSAKINELKLEIEKAKFVLVQTALEPKMDRREYRTLKKKIAKLEKEKMDVGFKAIDQARDIIDPSATNKARTFNKAFINTHLLEF